MKYFIMKKARSIIPVIILFYSCYNLYRFIAVSEHPNQFIINILLILILLIWSPLNRIMRNYVIIFEQIAIYQVVLMEARENKSINNINIDTKNEVLKEILETFFYNPDSNFSFNLLIDGYDFKIDNRTLSGFHYYMLRSKSKQERPYILNMYVKDENPSTINISIDSLLKIPKINVDKTTGTDSLDNILINKSDS